ncbi:MAG: hypothetical protein HC880_06050 [Bacteroidia bacterium]|nr:hypothetical protein [Bacteroidia bacterium]
MLIRTWKISLENLISSMPPSQKDLLDQGQIRSLTQGLSQITFSFLADHRVEVISPDEAGKLKKEVGRWQLSEDQKVITITRDQDQRQQPLRIQSISREALILSTIGDGSQETLVMVPTQ